MSSTRSIKQRIANVSSVEQLIKAMDMVASTKLVKARAQLEGVRPIYKELNRIIGEVASREEVISHVFFKERKVKNSLYIILTSDRGLSGGYSSKISGKALEHMNQGKNERLLIVGSKGTEYFNRAGKNIVKKVVDISDSQIYYGSENLAKWSMDLYLSGEVDEVFIAYTEFQNVLTYNPKVERVLPIGATTDDRLDSSEHKYEPDIDVFIDEMVPLYFHMNLFRAFSESHTSEQAARMVSMDSAGKNASDVIEDLTREYNRKRQAAITQEISEIVGSASILNKEE